jgi:predicted nucleic acid-binding protein
MVVCADTSFLFALYGNNTHTPRALRWTQGSRVPVSISELSEFELANALRFAEFRKALNPGAAGTYLAQFEADKTNGLIIVHTCNLANVIAQARRLSATHTLAEGHRGFDILHVAAALEMSASGFLTFGGNQMKLAKAEGLATPL